MWFRRSKSILRKFTKKPEYDLTNLEIGDVIAKGGSGTVIAAKHLRLGEEVVVKVSTVTKFSIKEADILNTLTHPNIIRLRHSEIFQDKVVLILERARCDIIDFLSEQTEILSDDSVREIFIQLTSAVEYLHSKKIVHRDIKLDNILVLHSGKFVLTDFGFSDYFNENRYHTKTCGTFEYASPELVKGHYVGPEVDIWALGVVLYVLVTGSLPFKRPTVDSKWNVEVQKLHIPDTVSNWLNDLLKRMLTTESSERINIPMIKQHPWFIKTYPTNTTPREHFKVLLANSLRESGKSLHTIFAELKEELKEIRNEPNIQESQSLSDVGYNKNQDDVLDHLHTHQVDYKREKSDNKLSYQEEPKGDVQDVSPSNTPTSPQTHTRERGVHPPLSQKSRSSPIVRNTVQKEAEKDIQTGSNAHEIAKSQKLELILTKSGEAKTRFRVTKLCYSPKEFEELTSTFLQQSLKNANFEL